MTETVELILRFGEWRRVVRIRDDETSFACYVDAAD